MTVDATTQTTPPNDAEAPEQPGHSETPEGGERTEPSKGEYHDQQALQHKIKAEQLNALMTAHGVSSVEELNEKLAQSPAAPAQTRTEPEDDGVDWDAVRQYAAKGDPVARAQIENRDRLDRLERGVGDAFSARDIQDPSERTQAIALYRKYPDVYGNLQAALAAVREPKLRNENAKLRDELAKLKKGPDPDVRNAPPTAGREIPATETKTRKMTLAQAMDHAAALRAAGQKDAAMRFLGSAEIEG